MGLIRRGNYWYYRIWVNGREYRGSTGLAATQQNRRRASEIEQAKRKELLALSKRGLPVERLTFREAADRFMAWCAEVQYRSRPATWMRMRTSMASLRAFFGDRTVDAISPGDIEQYKSWRATEHRVRDVTIRHDLYAASVFFQYCMNMGWTGENPVRKVSIPSDRDAVSQHVVTPDEERAYFSVAKGTLYDVARLILLTGARPEEIMCLRRGDVDLSRSVMHIRGGKTAAARRTIPLMAEAKAILSRRLAATSDQGPDGWLFPSRRKPGCPVTRLNNRHDDACRRAGVYFRLYDLRHTFATRLAESGCDLPTLASILGHASLRMITRYVHPTEQHRTEAIRRLESSMHSLGSDRLVLVGKRGDG